MLTCLYNATTKIRFLMFFSYLISLLHTMDSNIKFSSLHRKIESLKAKTLIKLINKYELTIGALMMLPPNDEEKKKTCLK